MPSWKINGWIIAQPITTNVRVETKTVVMVRLKSIDFVGSIVFYLIS